MKNILKVLVISCLTFGTAMTTTVMADQGKQMYAMHHGGGWKSSLTDEQQNKVAKLKLDYKKKKYSLKTQLNQAKVELALLITSDKPNQKEINKKIDQIVKLKKDKLHLMTSHKIAVRKILNDIQRVKFDMKILKSTYYGKKCDHYGHHGQH